MLRLPSFDYHAPESVAEAVALKARFGPEAMYVAGGTDLYPKMKRRQMTPPVLISLANVAELRTIHHSPFTLGAGVTLAEVAAHPTLQTHYPALAQAAGLAASPPLRNSGTLGGNLCLDTRCNHYDQSQEWRQALGFCMKRNGEICRAARSSPVCVAIAASDCAPAVIALGGTVRLVGPQACGERRTMEREMPAEALYREDGTNYLTKQPDELVTAVHLPPAAGWRSSYWKLRRRDSIDFPVLGVAAALRLDENGRCVAVRLVLGAVSSRPLLMPEEVVAPLIGQRVTAERIEQVAQAAARLARPLDNTDMQLGYRKKMTHVYVRGALAEAAGDLI